MSVCYGYLEQSLIRKIYHSCNLSLVWSIFTSLDLFQQRPQVPFLPRPLARAARCSTSRRWCHQQRRSIRSSRLRCIWAQRDRGREQRTLACSITHKYLQLCRRQTTGPSCFLQWLLQVLLLLSIYQVNVSKLAVWHSTERKCSFMNYVALQMDFVSQWTCWELQYLATRLSSFDSS